MNLITRIDNLGNWIDIAARNAESAAERERIWNVRDAYQKLEEEVGVPHRDWTPVRERFIEAKGPPRVAPKIPLRSASDAPTPV